MAYIESHQSLGTHRKTKELARLLKTDVPKAIGHLHLVWWWCLDNAPDGNLSKINHDDIADAALWKKGAEQFFDALITAGFVDDDTKILHDWGEYTGKLIENREVRRQQNREAQQRYRAKLASETPLVSKESALTDADSQKLRKHPPHENEAKRDCPPSFPTPLTPPLPPLVPYRTVPYRTVTIPPIVPLDDKGDGQTEDRDVTVDKESQETWQKVLKAIREEGAVSKTNYRTWFARTVGVNRVDGKFLIGVPSSFAADYLMKNQYTLIEKTLIGLNEKSKPEFIVVKSEGGQET